LFYFVAFSDCLKKTLEKQYQKTKFSLISLFIS